MTSKKCMICTLMIIIIIYNILASIIVNEFITSMLSGAHRVQRTKEHVTL